MGAEWEGLVADIQRALSSGTADKEAQQLAARWIAMLRRLCGDDVPLALFVTAGRHVQEWNPAFGKWPGFAFLADALAAHQLGAK